MLIRLTAFANLAGLLATLPFAIGETILSSQRDRSTYYEDHF